jgi:hypothetical protein
MRSLLADRGNLKARRRRVAQRSLLPIVIAMHFASETRKYAKLKEVEPHSFFACRQSFGVRKLMYFEPDMLALSHDIPIAWIQHSKVTFDVRKLLKCASILRVKRANMQASTFWMPNPLATHFDSSR